MARTLPYGALITGMVVADRRLQQYGELQARQVAAQEQIAANVGVLAARGDSQAETTAAAMRYLAKQNEEILAKLLHIETGRLSGTESLHDA